MDDDTVIKALGQRIGGGGGSGHDDTYATLSVLRISELVAIVILKGTFFFVLSRQRLHDDSVVPDSGVSLVILMTSA